jgi:hypothetical protein
MKAIKILLLQSLGVILCAREARRRRRIIMPHRINKWLDIFSRIITKIMKIDVVLAGH